MICVSVLSTFVWYFEQLWHSHLFVGKKKTDQHKSSETQDRSCDKEQVFQFRDRSDNKKKRGRVREKGHKQTTEQKSKKKKEFGSPDKPIQHSSQIFLLQHIAQIFQIVGSDFFLNFATNMFPNTHDNFHSFSGKEESPTQHNEAPSPPPHNINSSCSWQTWILCFVAINQNNQAAKKNSKRTKMLEFGVAFEIYFLVMTKLRQVLFWSELCLWYFALCCFVLLCLFCFALFFTHNLVLHLWGHFCVKTKGSNFSPNNKQENTLFSFFFDHWMIFELLAVLFCVNSFLATEIFSLEELVQSDSILMFLSCNLCFVCSGVRFFFLGFGDTLFCEVIVLFSARVVPVLVSSFDLSCWTQTKSQNTTKKTTISLCFRFFEKAFWRFIFHMTQRVNSSSFLCVIKTEQCGEIFLGSCWPI